MKDFKEKAMIKLSQGITIKADNSLLDYIDKNYDFELWPEYVSIPNPNRVGLLDKYLVFIKK